MGKSKKNSKKWSGGGSSDSGGIYFAGFIGSFIYYMQAAGSFMEVITGFLHALIWPATVVYKLLEWFYGTV